MKIDGPVIVLGYFVPLFLDFKERGEWAEVMVDNVVLPEVNGKVGSFITSVALDAFRSDFYNAVAEGKPLRSRRVSGEARALMGRIGPSR